MHAAFITALVVCLCGSLVSAEQPPARTGIINSGTLGRFNIRLTVAERFGQERYQERVATGVPFPGGMLKDTNKLYVLNPMGHQLKSRFTPLAYWPDGSISWVLVEFQADMPYPTREHFYLREGTRRYPRKPDRKFYSTLGVIDGEDSITVDTGVVKFVVRKKNFNLFDRVWVDDAGQLAYDDDSLVVDAGGELYARGADGTAYAAANDPGVRVSVADRTMMHAVIAADGRLTNEDGKGLIGFSLRIKAFENSNQILLDYTLRNGTGEPVRLAEAAARVSRRATDSMTFDVQFGSSAGNINGSIPKGKEAESVSLRVLDRTSFLVEGDGTAHVGTGPLKGDPSRGSDAAFGRGRVLTSADGKMLPTDYCITAAMKDFVRRPPAALRVGPAFGAAIRARDGGKEPAVIEPGGRITYRLAFSFSGFKSRPESDWATFRRPLRALCDPSWYCLDSGAFGVLAPSDRGYYREGNALDAAAFDRHFRKSFEAMGETDNSPGGLTHALILQFARTGRVEYLDTALDAAETAQASPAASLDVRDVFDRYCFTGDPLAKSAVMVRAKRVLESGAADVPALLAGAAITGESEYLDAAVSRASADTPADALVRLYELTGEKSVKDTLIAAAKESTDTGILAFAGEYTKDKALLDKGTAAFRASLSPLADTPAALAARAGGIRWLRHMADLGDVRGTVRRRRREGEIEIDLTW